MDYCACAVLATCLINVAVCPMWISRRDCVVWIPEGSLAGFLWVGFWGLGGPWELQNHPKQWGAKPLTFLDGFKAPMGRPGPQNRPNKFRPDCLQVPRTGSATVFMDIATYSVQRSISKGGPSLLSGARAECAECAVPQEFAFGFGRPIGPY